MANTKFTYQQMTKVSIDRNALREIATNESIDETDFRVLLVLFTELNGWDRYATDGNRNDPLNFKKIDKDSIAKLLYIKKKKVRDSIKNLINYGLLEKGSSDTVEEGYRLTF